MAINPETDFPEERFVPGARVWVGRPGQPPQPAAIVTSRPHNDRLLVRFDIARGRDAAQALTGSLVFIPASDARELGDDEYYVHELIGLHVETSSGDAVGVVTQFIETGAADVLVIQGDGRQHLIPLTGEVVDGVDLQARRLRIHPLPGLLE